MRDKVDWEKWEKIANIIEELDEPTALTPEQEACLIKALEAKEDGIQ